VPRCNAHRAERLMEKIDEAHNTVATASRDRKGVFKWVSMRCTSLLLVQIPPWGGGGGHDLFMPGQRFEIGSSRSNIYTTRRRTMIHRQI